MNRFAIFLLLYAFFITNDLLFIHASYYELWLFVDYLFKFLALYILFLFVHNKQLLLNELGLNTIAIKPFVLWTLLLTTVGAFVDQVVFGALNNKIDLWRFFDFPAIKDPFIERIDLIVGLLLTAFSEEIIFRGLIIMLLLSQLKSPFIAVIFSSLLFGFAHWGLGLALVISATLWAILPAISVIKTRSIYPAVVAHYITNFVDFAG